MQCRDPKGCHVDIQSNQSSSSAVANGERVVAKFSLSRWNGVKTSLKYRIIFTLADKYLIKAMCEFFGVSRSGYYAHRQWKDCPDRDLPLAEMIQECHAKRGRFMVIVTSIFGYLGWNKCKSTPKPPSVSCANMVFLAKCAERNISMEATYASLWQSI